MSGDKGWGQILLIGGGIVAAGGLLYYLYASDSSSAVSLCGVARNLCICFPFLLRVLGPAAGTSAGRR